MVGFMWYDDFNNVGGFKLFIILYKDIPINLFHLKVEAGTIIVTEL